MKVLFGNIQEDDDRQNKMLDRSPRRSVSKWKNCWRGLGQHCRSALMDTELHGRIGLVLQDELSRRS